MRTFSAIALLLLLAATPALGYTIYLKDGSTIVSPNKYEVQGDKAIITLASGTKTFLDFAEIDVERTDRENLINYGDAKIVGSDGTVTSVLPNAGFKEEKKPTLTDLVNNRNSARDSAPIRRQTPEASGPLPRTLSGGVDYSRLPSSPFRDLNLASEISRFFAGKSIEGISLYQGTTANHILIEVTTASEASVLNAVKTAANALIRVRETRGDQLEAIELNLVTPRRERAGQFTLTPEKAQLLASGSIELTDFFVRYVEF